MHPSPPADHAAVHLVSTGLRGGVVGIPEEGLNALGCMAGVGVAPGAGLTHLPHDVSSMSSS